MASITPADMKHFFNLSAAQLKQYADDQYIKEQLSLLEEQNRKEAQKKDQENKDFYDAVIMAAEYKEYRDFLFNLERLQEQLQEEVEELENEMARERESKSQPVETHHSTQAENQYTLPAVVEAQKQVDHAIDLVNQMNNLTQQHAASSAATQQYIQQWTQQTWVPQVAQLATNLTAQMNNPLATQLPQLQAVPQLATAGALEFAKVTDDIQHALANRKSTSDMIKHVPALAQRVEEAYNHHRDMGEDSLAAEQAALQECAVPQSLLLNEVVFVAMVRQFYQMIPALCDKYNVNLNEHYPSKWESLKQSLQYAHGHAHLLNQFHEKASALYNNDILPKVAQDAELLYQKTVCARELSGILENLHNLSSQMPERHPINEKMQKLIHLPNAPELKRFQDKY